MYHMSLTIVIAVATAFACICQTVYSKQPFLMLSNIKMQQPVLIVVSSQKFLQSLHLLADPTQPNPHMSSRLKLGILPSRPGPCILLDTQLSCAPRCDNCILRDRMAATAEKVRRSSAPADSCCAACAIVTACATAPACLPAQRGLLQGTNMHWETQQA